MDTLNADQKSTRNIVVAALLAFFLGGFGAHRFYMGLYKSGAGILLCSLVGVFLLPPLLPIVWIVVIVDFILILLKHLKDGDGRTF